MKRNHLSALTLATMTLIVTSVQAQIRVTGEQKQGGLITDLDNGSSRFNEYRDIRDGHFLQSARLGILDQGTGRYLNLSGVNLLRDDQTLNVTLGDWRNDWKLKFVRKGTPHRFANAAMTPYIYRGDGLYALPATVGIMKDGNDATGTPSLVPTAPQMAVNDALIADYMQAYVHPEQLGIQRDLTELTFKFAPSATLGLHLSLSNERRNGDRIGYGPIGDRPPRTLNVQLPEPVDFTTREVDAGVDYVGKRVQTQVKYTLSAFRNDLDSWRWQNLYFSPDPGLDYVAAVAGTARNVSQFGRKSLAPDNISHHVSLSTGIALPKNSRLTATAVIGLMKQNSVLLPYSYSTLGGDHGVLTGDNLAWNDPAKLPRATAEAEMQTLRLNVDYAINPMPRLRVRAYGGYESLDNRTPTADWKYPTNDAANTNGDVNYRSYFRNEAYAFDRVKFGLDARRTFAFWHSSLGLELKRQSIGREHREADTDENSAEFTLRASPTRAVTVKGGILVADRSASEYDYKVTSEAFWYTFDQGANEVDNPQFLFANHPDLRKFDVSDRARLKANLAATVVTRSNLDFTVAYAFLSDDFTSDVEPVAPMLGTTVPIPNPADASAMTPGKQLGLLENATQSVSAEVNFAASDRWYFSAYAGLEDGKYLHRGMVFNENQRRQPSNATIQVPTQLGPWTDPNRQYESDIRQSTTSFGVSVRHELIPGKLRVIADYRALASEEDMSYSGYGSDPSYLGVSWETFQFGWDDPATVTTEYTTLTAAVEYEVNDRVRFGVQYMFDRFEIVDWQLDMESAALEQVASPYFVRDTSRDNRWGNRLVNMGGNLAPGYVFHGVGVSLTYGF